MVATCPLADGPHIGPQNWQLNGDKGSTWEGVGWDFSTVYAIGL